MMLTSFFILCDQSERAAPELMSRPLLGGFIKGGVCATLAWGVAWVCASSSSLCEDIRFVAPSTLRGDSAGSRV
jgi:hypothetical protein